MKIIKLVKVILLLCLFVCGCEGFAKQRRVSYIRKHPELSPAQKELLQRGKLWVGMKPKEVRCVLGSPFSTSKDKLGKLEAWTYVYRNQYTPHRKFMFERTLRLEFREGLLNYWRED